MSTTIILDNEIAEIQQLKAMMNEYGATHNIEQAVIQDVNLVLEEAISNIMFYGYEDTAAHQITVKLDVNDTTLEIEICDDAKAYNPLETPKPDLDIPFDDREIGGMGVYLMRTIMDDMAYTREAGQNVLFLKKSIVTPAS